MYSRASKDDGVSVLEFNSLNTESDIPFHQTELV